MKNIARFSILIILMVATSCQKEGGDSTFDERRNNIIGEWSLSETTDTNPSGLIFTINFNADGTGRKETTLFGNDIDFEWVYQFNPEQIVIKEEAGTVVTEIGQLNTLAQTRIFDILRNTEDQQEWITDDGFPFGGDPFDLTWNLSR